MATVKREELDARIVELWRAGLQSATDIGLKVGLTPLHVGRRMARMSKTRTWPFDLPPNTPRGDEAARRAPAGMAVRPRPSVRLEPPREVGFTPLNLRISGDLYTRLRGYCRETGATVSETAAEALEVFLRSKQKPRW